MDPVGRENGSLALAIPNRRVRIPAWSDSPDARLPITLAITPRGADMQPETMTEPVALPRDAKPSEILESQPRDRWCTGGLHETLTDGTERFCRVGWLAYVGGYKFRGLRCPLGDYEDAYDFVSDYYGLPLELVSELMPTANDDEHVDGYEAALCVIQNAGY